MGNDVNYYSMKTINGFNAIVLPKFLGEIAEAESRVTNHKDNFWENIEKQSYGQYHVLANYLEQVIAKGYENEHEVEGPVTPQALNRSIPDIRCVYSGLKGKRTDDSNIQDIHLLFVSTEDMSRAADRHLIDRHLIEAYENALEGGGNALRRNFNYILYKVWYGTLPEKIRSKYDTDHYERADFFGKDICKRTLNLYNFKVNSVNSLIGNFHYEDPDQLHRWPSDIQGMTENDRRITVKAIIEDAVKRVLLNPGLAYPMGLNHKTGAGVISPGQFVIPLYRDENNPKPMLGLTIKTIMHHKSEDYIFAKSSSEEGISREEKERIKNAIEFSFLTYSVNTILPLEDVRMNVLPYVNCDVSNLWCKRDDE